MNENAELNQLLQNTHHDYIEAIDYIGREGTSYSQSKREKQMAGCVQFTTGDSVRFFPAAQTTHSLPPGVYEIFLDSMKGLGFQKLDVKTEGLIRFPETNSERVLDEIESFWNKEDRFKRHGIHYKRGIILWGPAGSGKSSTIQLVMADVIKRGGVCIKFNAPGLFLDGIRVFREIQPDTPIVGLMEDIDSTIEIFNESEVLQILDGVDQIEKVVYLATTNHPERLGARIMNRPSRFDRRFKMGHPKAKSRRLYFEHRFDEETLKEFNVDLDKWVKDSEGMSIAHLKEMFISVCIFGNPYDEVVETLRLMIENHPVSERDDVPKNVGFGKNQSYDENNDDFN